VVEVLASKCEAPTSNPSTAEREREKERDREREELPSAFGLQTHIPVIERFPGLEQGS
jgi:hypothetical protein